MRQSYYNNNCISSPWWLLAGSSLTGDILIVGELEAGDLCLMRALAKSVKSISLDNFATEQPTGLYSSVFLMTKDIKDKSRRNALAAGITKKLRDDGVLIVYGQEVRPENCTLQISLPCITYNKYPFEAYQKGNYSSNKNQCLIKEKIKRIILNLPLYKLFIHNHIYVYSKSSKQSHLLTELDRLIASHHNTFIKRDQNRKLSKLYFKYGKVIAIYNSLVKHANLVIVIPTDQEAQRQRLNEHKTITALQGNKWLKGYVVDFYIETEVLGFMACIMEEVEGNTVDAPCNGLKTMQHNAYVAIQALAKYSNQGQFDATQLGTRLTDYIRDFNQRMSQHGITLDLALEQVVHELLGLPIVCMHGDMKLENFVLDGAGKVKKIIDWELSDLHGLPLLDLFYFIAYNQRMETGHSLSESIYQLAAYSTNQRYAEWIKDYAMDNNINARQTTILFVLFVIHHFAYRQHIDSINNDDLLRMQHFIQQCITKLTGRS